MAYNPEPSCPIDLVPNISLISGVLSTPANVAFLNVAGERRNYSEDEVLVFDDSFFHAAENGHASEARYVLSVDFWKPGLLV